MITHGTPPCRGGGWYEFIKDLRIGLGGKDRCIATAMVRGGTIPRESVLLRPDEKFAEQQAGRRLEPGSG